MKKCIAGSTAQYVLRFQTALSTVFERRLRRRNPGGGSASAER